MSICVTCGKNIPRNIWIDGKKRYSSAHRKYCFECSAFGDHNTKRLEKVVEKNDDGEIIYPERTCPECGKIHRKRGFVCQGCVFNKKLKKTLKKVESIVGNSCWICGYNKTKRSLCFHHVEAKEKLFSLSGREINLYSWERVSKEMKKCIFICNNCHGEIHDGLFTRDQIEKLWKEKVIEDRTPDALTK